MAQTGADRLALARALAGAEPLDVSAALALLNTMSDAISPPARDAVEHAKRAVASMPGGDHRHQAIARYMIARVVVILETIAREEAGQPGGPVEPPR